MKKIKGLFLAGLLSLSIGLTSFTEDPTIEMIAFNTCTTMATYIMDSEDFVNEETYVSGFMEIWGECMGYDEY